MIRQLKKLLRNPVRYAPVALKVAQQQLSYLFQHRSFFLQGQMDINPKSRWFSPEFVDRTGGFLPPADPVHRQISDLEPWDTTRRDMLILLLRMIVVRGVEGDLAELGVYRGFTARLIHHYLPERPLHLFDTFEGFNSRDVEAEKEKTSLVANAGHFGDTSLERARAYVGPVNQNVHFHKGLFPDSIPEGFGARRFALAHLDADLYEPITEGLRFFYPRMSPGGLIVVHDYNAWLGARQAVDDYFADKPEVPVPMPDKSGSALIVKQA